MLETIAGLGHETVPISLGKENEVSRVDVLLLNGPWGSLERVFRGLRATPTAGRAVPVLWQGE